MNKDCVKTETIGKAINRTIAVRDGRMNQINVRWRKGRARTCQPANSAAGEEGGECAPFPFYIGLQEAFFLGRRSVGRFNIGQGLFRAFPALQELGNFRA